MTKIMTNKEAPVANKRIITALEIILIILAFYAAYRYASSEIALIKTFIVHSGPYGILVSMLLFGVLGATPIPAEPFTVLLSTIYGPFWAMIATAIGTLLSALVEYFISSRIGNAANFEVWRQKLPFGLGKFPVDSPAFLIGSASRTRLWQQIRQPGERVLPGASATLYLDDLHRHIVGGGGDILWGL